MAFVFEAVVGRAL